VRPPSFQGTSAAFAIAILLTAACSQGAELPGDAAIFDAAEAAAAVSARETVPAARGQAVFDQICTACHTVQPPPNLAPPMMAVSGYYRDAFTDRDEAVAAMVAYIQDPDSTRSQLRPEAFRRFGIMAPLPLLEEDRRAVATWIWEMYDAEADPRPARARSPGQ